MNDENILSFGRTSRFGRKLLQQNSLNNSQSSFIALIVVICVLLALVIVLLVILFCRYCRRTKKSEKHPKKFKPILSYPDDPIPKRPAISTSSAVSSPQITTRSNDVLVPATPVEPNRKVQRTNFIDNYLHDLSTLDPRKLDPFLFIDLHSTSSETFPETQIQQMRSRPNITNTTTSGYHTTTFDEENIRKRVSQTVPTRSWRPVGHVSSNRSRFLVRERNLPTNLSHLPQLRQGNISSNENNPSDSSFFSNYHDIPSTNVSITTDDYDESHAYHVHQQQIMKTIHEEKTNQHRAQYVEVVSTYRGDDSDLLSETRLKNNAFSNESIIV